MTTQTISAAELEELLSNEIPCGGNTELRCRRDCTRAAVLKGSDHGCTEPTGPKGFKCVTCWQAWYITALRVLAEHGHLKCYHCGRKFTTVESFSDYRAF